MNKTAFVSAADSNYYPMLREWVHSIRRFEQSAGATICIMDVGLTPEQVEKLKDIDCVIHKPDWPCNIPERQIRGREYLKGCVCRPFINKYFPDYDTYIWMDPDTWIQKWSAIEMFIKGADQNAITLSAQSDRAYPRQIRIKWLGNIPLKLRGFYFSNAKAAYGSKVAKELYAYHVLLAGMFALKGSAPHWQRWQELMVEKLKAGKGKVFTSDQLTLGKLCYLENFKKIILPGYMHWLCEFKPLWNTQKQMFVEPYLPNEELGVLHISGWDDMRKDRSVMTDFETLDGKEISYTYRYPYFDGEAEEEINILDQAA
ncbi:MAG: glycosyl transferase family 8 [Micavibrio sp.]|nr:glycosyl transferase family 8 [Micavibrio sp.]